MSTKLRTIAEGDRINKLTVLRKFSPEYDPSVWVCQCECGRTTVFSGRTLRTGEANSCGCDKKRIISAEEAAKRREKELEDWSDDAEDAETDEMIRSA